MDAASSQAEHLDTNKVGLFRVQNFLSCTLTVLFIQNLSFKIVSVKIPTSRNKLQLISGKVFQGKRG
jgi:hypothetical protein